MKSLSCFLMGLFALLAGCSSTHTLSGHMADWQGENVGVAVAAWGEPEVEHAFGDETVFIWRDRAYSVMPQPAVSDFESATVICERMLAVSDAGTITGWRWRGDACSVVYSQPDLKVQTLSHSAY